MKKKLTLPTRTDNLRVVALRLPEPIIDLVDRIGEAGLSQAGAEALVGRWSSVEAAGGPLSVNPKSGAAGIGQWLGRRRRRFSGDYDSRLGHAIAELNGSERRAGDVLRGATTHEEGARGASMYERAEGYNARSSIDRYTGKTARAADAVHGAIASPADTAQRLHDQGSASRAPVHHHHGDVVIQGASNADAVTHAVLANIEARTRHASHDVYTDV